MEFSTGMKQDTVQAAADGSQNTGSFDLNSVAQSLENIIPQVCVSEASVPAGFPTVSTPVRMLQACLDETVSGVSVSRHEMLEAISHIDTDIDKMTGGQLVEKLAAVNLDTSGSVKMLKRRLKSYYKHLRVSQYHQLLSGSEKMQFDYLVVIDFEATCDESDASFVQEIIEFPAVLVDIKNLAVHGVFHSFCKPRVNPLLTTFCTSLTDIAQAKVDQAKDFTEVLKDFEQWLHLYQLGTVYHFAVVTDGSYDMAKFFKLQLELSGIRLPFWARQWVNIRKVYSAFNSCGSMNLQQMLSAAGMQFQDFKDLSVSVIDIFSKIIGRKESFIIATLQNQFKENRCNVDYPSSANNNEKQNATPKMK